MRACPHGLFGVVQDAHLGSALACGAGSTATELLKDVMVNASGAVAVDARVRLEPALTRKPLGAR